MVNYMHDYKRPQRICLCLSLSPSIILSSKFLDTLYLSLSLSSLTTLELLYKTKLPRAPSLKMRSFTAFLTILATALLLNLCISAPLTELAQDVSNDATDLINSVLPVIDGFPDNSTTNGTDPLTENRCYNWDTSEKWKDVGGQHSDYVNQAVYNLCQLIAIDAYKGWPAGNTVSDSLPQHPMPSTLSPPIMK